MTNKSCEHNRGIKWVSDDRKNYAMKTDYSTCPFCAKAEHEEYEVLPGLRKDDPIIIKKEHEEKPSAEQIAKKCLQENCVDWKQRPDIVSSIADAITQERLAWEKKVDELVKTQLHHLNLLSDYQKKVAELETLLRSTNNDKAFWQDRISTLQSKLDEAVKAVEGVVKARECAHRDGFIIHPIQMVDASIVCVEVLRKIKEM